MWRECALGAGRKQVSAPATREGICDHVCIIAAQLLTCAHARGIVLALACQIAKMVSPW